MNTPTLDELPVVHLPSLSPEEALGGFVTSSSDPTGSGPPEFQITAPHSDAVDGDWAAGSWDSAYDAGAGGTGTVDVVTPLISTILPDPSVPRSRLVLWARWGTVSGEHPKRRACMLVLG
jgi:hypothetical protein